MSYILQGSGALLGPCLSHLLGREVARYAPCICLRCAQLLSTASAASQPPAGATAAPQRLPDGALTGALSSAELGDRPFFQSLGSGRPLYRARDGVNRLLDDSPRGPQGYAELRRRFPHAAFQQKFFTNFSAALPYLGNAGPVNVNLTFLCDPGVSHTGAFLSSETGRRFIKVRSVAHQR